MITSTINIKDLIGDRIDPLQFHPERMKMIHAIMQGAWKKLKDVTINVKTITKSFNEGDIYIGLENIVSNTGEYVSYSSKETISSAARFKKGDILFPKLRPYLNKVHRAQFDGCCSTEFHVFKAKDILPDFLMIVLQSNIVIAQTNHLMTGNTLPRLQTSDIDNLLIPYPSIELQQEIVEIYSKAQEERSNKKQEAESITNTIDTFILKELGISFSHDIKKISSFKLSISSILGQRYDTYYHQPYFEEAFSKLLSSHYPTKSLRDISLVITSGITPKSGGSDYSNQTEGIPFIRSGDIDINGDIDFDNLLYITQSIHNTKMKSSKVMKNDIMIAIVGATIGQIGIYLSDREANINQAIALVRLKTGINPEYVKEILQSSIGQLNLDRLKRPVARANINLEEVASIMIPIPDINKQNEIVNKIKAIRLQAKQLQQEGDALLKEAKQRIEELIIG